MYLLKVDEQNMPKLLLLHYQSLMLIYSIDMSDEEWDEVEKAWAESQQDED